MAHRTKQGQELHDRKVAEVARNLERRGYDVRADLPGHPRPPAIDGYVPDVVAVKGRKVLVREVETQGTVATDRDQHRAFDEWAERNSADFRILIAKRR